jgi:beta-galactosidase
MFLLVCVSSAAFGQAERTEMLLTHSWRFEKGDPAGAEQPSFDDSSWRTVTVPHDWSIEDLEGQNHPFDPDAVGEYDVGYTVGGTAWYRVRFTLDAADSGKIVHLEFGGAYMNSDVWVNGTHVGSRPYGYSTFWFDVTNYVNFGTETVVAVQVKNEGMNSRWYSGSGIYRPVTVTLTDPVHINHWGPFVTTPTVSTSSADVNVATEVKNESGSSETVTLESTILDSNSNVVATDSTAVSIPGLGSYVFDQTMVVSNPDLWSMDSPTLYTMSQEVIVGGQTVDYVDTSFGIRSISFDANNGFLLNGESVLLQGACMHHDNYMLGAAAYERAEQRRVEAVQEAGFNCIRTAHNPPSRAFLDACDRLGMLVIDESFDMWNEYKWDHVDDYSKYFANWWDIDLDSMVLRDRNHASIIIWSIGNEIPEQGDSGAATAEMLANYIRALDPTRPITVAANKAGSAMDLYFSKVDLAGYNYRPNDYLSDHDRVPDRVIWGSESYAEDAFAYWKYVEDYSFIIGDFVWTAFDYLGEAGIGWTGYSPGWRKLAPYPWHAAYCGDVDLTGYKRPAAYYRQVLWKTGKNKVSAFVTSPVDSLPDQSGAWKLYWVYPDIHPRGPRSYCVFGMRTGRAFLKQPEPGYSGDQYWNRVQGYLFG